MTGEIEPLLAARGLAAGWGASLAAAPFVAPWGALVIGLLAGLLFPLLLYLVEAKLRLRDAAGTVALGLAGGLWGALAVGLFADGRSGQGWNGVGADAVYGVAGIVAGGGVDQLLAQLAGLLALLLWGLLWGALVGGIVRLAVTRPWQRNELEAAAVPASEPVEESEPTAAEKDLPESTVEDQPLPEKPFEDPLPPPPPLSAPVVEREEGS